MSYPNYWTINPPNPTNAQDDENADNYISLLNAAEAGTGTTSALGESPPKQSKQSIRNQGQIKSSYNETKTTKTDDQEHDEMKTGTGTGFGSESSVGVGVGTDEDSTKLQTKNDEEIELNTVKTQSTAISVPRKRNTKKRSKKMKLSYVKIQSQRQRPEGEGLVSIYPSKEKQKNPDETPVRIIATARSILGNTNKSVSPFHPQLDPDSPFSSAHEGHDQVDPATILSECESYINWVTDPTLMTQESLQRQIEQIQTKYVKWNEENDAEFIRKYSPLEHISNLGALCFYHIESKNFLDAFRTIEKTRDFVLPVIKEGHLPVESIESFDYVWVFLRIRASLREWLISKQLVYFPEINVTHVPSSLRQLSPKVRAGVLGLKFYFFRLQKAPYDAQIEILRKAISLDQSNYEWHYHLHLVLRNRRKELSTNGILYRGSHGAEEVRELTTAIKLAPTNPRCILSHIQYVADHVKHLSKENKSMNFQLGDTKFQSIISVKSYLHDQTVKILTLSPTSVTLRTALADIFSVGLPNPHRNHLLAKEILTTCLRFCPNSVKANYRMGLFYLTVEVNYWKAEEYFAIAHKQEAHSYPVITSLLYMMLRKVASRQDEIVHLIDASLENLYFWDKKQEGGLRYLKALALSAGSVARVKQATDEFIKAYRCNENALSFSELPYLHRRYGWPDWEKNSRLTFDKLRQKISKVESAGFDPERKRILQKILNELDTAALVDTKSSSKWKT